MQQATYDAVDEVGPRRARPRASTPGSTRAARSSSRAGRRACRRSRSALAEYGRFGFGDRYRLLDGDELAARIRIAGAVRALVSDDAAVVHPGRLIRGLARAVERDRRPDRRGDAGHRRSGRRTRPAGRRWSRRAGEVRAPVIVLAGEAYLVRAAGAAPPARPAVVADRAHRAGQRRAVGRDRLARTGRSSRRRGSRSTTCRAPRTAGSCSAAAVPRTGSGSPIRPDVRPPRPHPRAAAGLRPRVVPVAPRRPVHARVGRAAGHAARLAPDDGVRPGHRASPPRAGYIGHGVSTTNLAGRVLTDLDHRRRRAR